MVERTFGAWKKRFPILSQPQDYSLDTQRDLVFALAVVHNFTINHARVENVNFFDPIPELQAGDGGTNEAESQMIEPAQLSNHEKHELREWHDGIAEDMWDQYQTHLRRHPNQY